MTCELQDTTWSEKTSTNANEYAQSLYKHPKHSAWPPRPHVVSHRSLEARLSATRSQCTFRSEEKKWFPTTNDDGAADDTDHDRAQSPRRRCSRSSAPMAGQPMDEF